AQHEGVSAVAVGLGERAVDGDAVAAALDRVLSLLDLDGDVPIDDEDVVAATEERADLADEGGVVDEVEVGVLAFLVGLLVGDEGGLEGGHLVLAEEGGAWPAPHVPEPV